MISAPRVLAAAALFVTGFAGVLVAAPPRRRAVAIPSRPGDGVSLSGVEIRGVARPQPVTARGLSVLAWELVIRNTRGSDVTVEAVDVLAGTETLLSYAGVSLRSILGNIPERSAGSDPPPETIRPGERAILYLWMTARGSTDVPAEISHRVRIVGAGGTETSSGPIVGVRPAAAITLAAPLIGRWWRASDGPANDSLHRRTPVVVGDVVQIAHRFAVDWVRLDDGGASFSGDPAKNASYFGYGTDVLAVADATIAAVRDGIPDNTPPGRSLGPETAAGNYVILDVGGTFVVYEHLQTGSVRVKSGASVTRGETIARTGNSGDSAQPHLHLHVCDAGATVECNGLPFVLDRFLTPDGGRLLEMPLKDDLVDFQ